MSRSIVVITTSFPRTPSDEAGIFVRRLVQALSGKGEAGSVIVPKDVTSETLNQVGKFEIKRTRYGLLTPGSLAFGAGIMPNLRRSPLRALQIPTLFFAFSYAAWKATNRSSIVSAQWIFSALAAYLVSRLRQIPYTVTVRGEDFRLLKHGLLGAPFRFALRRASAVITVSHSFQNDLRSISGIEPSRIHLIENGIEVLAPSAETPSAHPLPFSRSYIVFIGTVIPRKRVDALIELLAHESLNEYDLIVCGRLDDSAEHKKLISLAEGLRVASRVHFEGAVPPEMAAYYIRHAAAYVSASEFEGKPNAALEALAAGKVVFLSDIPAHKEIIEDGKNGALFKREHTPEAAQCLAKLLSDEAKSASMRQEAQKSVSHLTWERTAEQYRKIFDEITSQK